MTEIEGSRFSPIRPQTHKIEGGTRFVEQTPQQRRTDTLSACRLPDIEVSDPACGSAANVGIAVEPAHPDEGRSRECAEEAFTRLIEPVGAGLARVSEGIDA
jgi:hypothetical protein